MNEHPLNMEVENARSQERHERMRIEVEQNQALKMARKAERGEQSGLWWRFKQVLRGK